MSLILPPRLWGHGLFPQCRHFRTFRFRFTVRSIGRVVLELGRAHGQRPAAPTAASAAYSEASAWLAEIRLATSFIAFSAARLASLLSAVAVPRVMAVPRVIWAASARSRTAFA